MDVDHSFYQLTAKNNDPQAKLHYMDGRRIRGSALEHQAPEMMFSTDENPAYGMSAVKAMQLAAAEGQKIWQIDQSNLSTALSSINMNADVESDIRNAVLAGYVVTAHERDVTYQGITGAGYFIVDPNTGAGKMLIDGGQDGSNVGLRENQLAIILTGMLGYSDAASNIQLNNANTIWFLKELEHAKNLAKASQGLGAAMYILSTIGIVFNDDLALPDKGGQIGVNFVTAWLSLELTTVIASSSSFLALAGPVGIVALSVAIVTALAVAAVIINNYYFTFLYVINVYRRLV